METKKFVSIFKINNVPIMPPIVDKKEILKIRELVKMKELKMQKQKEEKDRVNIAKQLAEETEKTELEASMGPRRLSYTLTSPIFEISMLPKIYVDSSESDRNTVVEGPASFQTIDSEIDENANDKSSKDLKNEIDKRSITPASSIYQELLIEPQINNKLKELIDRQKQEYLIAMEALKDKFTNEQQHLLLNFQSHFITTSTPLNSSIVPSNGEVSDEDFTEFKTCLQSQSLSLEEKTIINDQDAKIKASVIINAAARGFLARRLMKTIYVQEHIRNIKETLHLVLSLNDHDMGGSPVQNVLLKTKLFRQLQRDLYNFNEIFMNSSIKEQMKIIAADRDITFKRNVEENEVNLSLSFKDVV